jgi:hypothetical protein
MDSDLHQGRGITGRQRLQAAVVRRRVALAGEAVDISDAAPVLVGSIKHSPRCAVPLGPAEGREGENSVRTGYKRPVQLPGDLGACINRLYRAL